MGCCSWVGISCPVLFAYWKVKNLKTLLKPFETLKNLRTYKPINFSQKTYVFPALYLRHYSRFCNDVCGVSFRSYAYALALALVDRGRTDDWLTVCGRPTAPNMLFTEQELKLQNWEHAFSVSGPSVWNSLPADLPLVTDTVVFKRKLKSYLFRFVFTQ